MKMKVLKSGALAILLGCLFLGNAVNAAASEEAFQYAFNFALGTPATTQHISQTVKVYGGASEYAKAYCTYFTVSFTSTSTVGKNMRYYKAIPPTNRTVKFQGQVTQYSTSFTIGSKVRG